LRVNLLRNGKDCWNTLQKANAVSQETDMQTKIRIELDRALDVLRLDAERVEMWVGALKGAAEPLPDYLSRYRRLKIPACDVRF
jgi:hypothetical protein